MLLKNKRGVHGPIVLLVTIAFILIATLTVAILVTQTRDFAEESYSITNEVRQKVLSGVEFVEVIGLDGRDGELNTLEMLVKLLPDSEGFELSSMSILLKTQKLESVLAYASGVDYANNASGYYTYRVQDINLSNVSTTNLDFSITSLDVTGYNLETFAGLDFDGDGSVDTVSVCNGAANGCAAYGVGTHLVFDLSSLGSPVFAELINNDGTPIDISGATAVPVFMNITAIPIGSRSSPYGFVSIFGTTGDDNSIGLNGENVTIYNMPIQLDEDFDGDTFPDYLALNDTNVFFFLSNSTEPISIELGDNVNSSPSTYAVNEKLTLDSEDLATITIYGTSTTDDQLDDGVEFKITPTNLGVGTYAMKFLKRGNDPIAGFLTHGDVIKVYSELPNSVTVNDIIEVSIISEKGATSPKSIFIGHTIPSSERISLYPKV